MVKRSYGYCRRSTDTQKTDSQKAEVQKYLNEQRLTVEWLEDCGSGKNTARPGYQKLLSAVRAGWVDVVVVYDATRIGRNIRNTLEFVEACRERAVRLVCVKDRCDLDSPQGRLMFNLLSSMAEYQREDIVERTKSGIAARRARCRLCGQPHAAHPHPKCKVFVGTQHGGTSKGWTCGKVAKLLPRLYLMQDAGMSARHISRVLGLNMRTVKKYMERDRTAVKTQRQTNLEEYGKSNIKE